MALLSFLCADPAWRSGTFPPPWEEGRSSIYAHILAAQSDGNIHNADLPDEARARGDGAIGYARGAMDNLVTAGQTNVTPLVEALRAVLKAPSQMHLSRLYALLMEHSAISVADQLIADLRPVTRKDAVRLETLMSWLACSAPDREPVKLAIALLGVVAGPRQKDLFLVFCAHEEFTKFASFALQNSLPPEESEAAFLHLVKQVHGWGRINLVRRLALSDDETFRYWLVREGYRNKVSGAYLAHIAATSGNLLWQFRQPGAGTDRALLDGAAGIFSALVALGPAQGMNDYPDGAEAVLAWLGFLTPAALTLEQAAALRDVIDHAGVTGEPDAFHSIWTESEAAVIESQSLALLESDVARALISEALRTGDSEAYWFARNAAPAAGIDLWPFAWTRQQSSTGEVREAHWFDLMRTDDPARVDSVIALALDQLPLGTLSAGPVDEVGIGPDWSAHRELEYIVRGLKRFPGKGWPLIAAALRSPVIDNRRTAIGALSAWGEAAWPPEALACVRRAFAEEPRADLCEELAALLRQMGLRPS